MTAPASARIASSPEILCNSLGLSSINHKRCLRHFKFCFLSGYTSFCEKQSWKKHALFYFWWSATDWLSNISKRVLITHYPSMIYLHLSSIWLPLIKDILNLSLSEYQQHCGHGNTELSLRWSLSMYIFRCQDQFCGLSWAFPHCEYTTDSNQASSGLFPRAAVTLDCNIDIPSSFCTKDQNYSL